MKTRQPINKEHILNEPTTSGGRILLRYSPLDRLKAYAELDRWHAAGIIGDSERVIHRNTVYMNTFEPAEPENFAVGFGFGLGFSLPVWAVVIAVVRMVA